MHSTKIPKELMKIISLFKENELEYNLFKCEHILSGINSNLDILFRTNNDYIKAGKLLQKKGFLLYMPENVEKVDIDTTKPQANINIHQHDHSFPETHRYLLATVCLL